MKLHVGLGKINRIKNCQFWLEKMSLETWPKILICLTWSIYHFLFSNQLDLMSNKKVRFLRSFVKSSPLTNSRANSILENFNFLFQFMILFFVSWLTRVIVFYLHLTLSSNLLEMASPSVLAARHVYWPAALFVTLCKTRLRLETIMPVATSSRNLRP